MRIFVLFPLLIVLGGCGKPDLSQLTFTELVLLAEQGDAQAQCELGKMRWDGTENLAKDRVKSVKWMCKAAEQGLAEAQNILGEMYAKGDGVTKDLEKAFKWFGKAAEQGYAKAQFNLGGAYLYGNGVAEDKAEAIKWIRKAAEQDYELAQRALNNLGVE